MRELTPFQLGWVVGIIEGEGSIGLYRGGKKSDSGWLIVGMSDEDTVKRLHAVTGIGILGKQQKIKDRRTNGELYKCSYRWSVNRQEDLYAILTEISPWLSARRQVKANEVLEWLSTRRCFT